MTKAKILPKFSFSPHRLHCSGSTRRQGIMDPWNNQGKGDHNHHIRSYKICITKSGKVVTCNLQQKEPTPISAEQYLHDH